MRLALACLLALALAAPTASAGTPEPDYRIDWFTLDGGGGTSVSGDGSFELSGTIGQPDADVVSLCSADGGPTCLNPSFELTGGFWAGLALPGGGASPSCSGDLECIFRDGFEGG